jgi:hypothetical protein
MKEKPKKRIGRPPKIRENSPSYGQQKKGQTKLALSCDSELADDIRKKAESEDKTVSEWLRDAAIKGLGLFVIAHLAYHYFTGNHAWLTEGLSQAMANALSIGTLIADSIANL